MNRDLQKDDVAMVQEGRKQFFRSCSLNSAHSEAGFHESSLYELYCTGFDYAPSNGIFETKKDSNLQNEEIEEITSFFTRRGLPFVWWGSNKRLKNFGFEFGGVMKGVSADLSEEALYDDFLSKNISIKKASTEEDFQAFSEVLKIGFGLSENVADQFVTMNQSSAACEEQIHYLALIDQEVVGTITLASIEDSAGVWNGTTLPEYRKRGVATALLATAMQDAVKLGYCQVMGILMPEGLAFNLCSNFGFQEICDFPFYIHGATADKVEK